MATSSKNDRRGERKPAATLPVARVCVDVALPHLNRLFDYLVPEQLADDAVVGCRVRVRFHGKAVDGLLWERAEDTAFTGSLLYLERVVSPEPVLSPEIAELIKAVAERYAGVLTNVVRLAIPPRHARVEAKSAPEPAPPPPAPESEGWSRYPRGRSYLDAMAAGRQAHAVWQALPGEDWPARLAEVVTTVAATGRGVAVVVPDHRDVARVHAACVQLIGADGVVALSADLGPSERYKRWLLLRRGAVRVVVGTRAACFAPIEVPGLLVVWDDGDSGHATPFAPYPHARDVLVERAHLTGASLLVAGFARTAEAQLLVDSGWAHEIVAAREQLRAAAPRVVAVGETDEQLARDEAARTARLPGFAFDAARAALKAGAPVLVQVPRRGYVPALACAQCRTRAMCRRCAGPLSLPGGQDDGMPRPAACRWCGAAEAAFRCPACGSRRLRAVVVGSRRTAEELGRAFPGFAVRTSGAGEVLAEVPDAPALVVCTPGAEPVAQGSYGAALLLDGWAMLGRRPARQRAGAAALDDRRRPGQTRGRGGQGGGHRGVRAPGRAGTDPLGPGVARQPGTGRSHRAGLPARRADGRGGRLAGRGQRPARGAEVAAIRRGARAGADRPGGRRGQQ
ncbi:Putative primosomal protein N' [Kutzneria albida DSM 43870]|uniref:Putative primosomal protein N n=1 Tax=Kutzneria albida DSM 43870 TaxID=1449976 RepID=W5W5Y0_9PSEU|nr:Putative primosomal protein N' [Kutzneria albida DSM 43870]